MKSLASSRIIKTSLGQAVVVARLELLDTEPAILAAGLPVLVEDELLRFASLTPAEKASEWARRVTACGEYRAAKAANPKLTVDQPLVQP